jgi:serine protease Do
MDNNDNQFKDSLNQAPGINAQEAAPSNDRVQVDVHFDSPSEPDTHFDGILSNTVFSEPRVTRAPLNQPTYNQQPFTQANFNEPRFAESFNREPQFFPPNEPNYHQSQIPSFNEPLIPVRRKKTTMWVALGVIALLLFTSILAIQAAFRSRPNHEVPILPASRSTGEGAPSPTELSNSFREISKTVKPAVVYIEVSERVSEEQQTPDIFGLPNPGGSRRQQSVGSGFVVTTDGYVITNNHVVANASKIEVTLSDSRKYKAKVIGTDRETDLAVIKIEETGLPVAVLGNSDEAQQGDWVLALGSPFGLQQTLTAGIISATGRENPTTQLGKFIQTDASINPGNSGGPLISMNAEVIGINSFILSRSRVLDMDGGNIGIGFAVTSNIARQVFNEIVKKGRVSRGYLGVNPREIDDALARSYGVEPRSGVLIAGLPGNDTPAAKAGLRLDDIITAFNGKKVTSPRELTDAVTATPVGESCKVDFIRDGQPQSVTVVLAERPAERSANQVQPNPQMPGIDPAAATAPNLGLSAQEITPDMAARMNLKLSGGVLVKTVAPNSPAGEAGIRHGDVIHRIDKTVVKNGSDLSQADRGLKNGDKIAVQVERNGNILFLTVTLE